MSPRQSNRAAASALAGNTIEYYDFIIYGLAAALVFPTVFFPVGDPAVATLLSLGTFAAAYLIRPIGAIVVGHLGDRIGRKPMLVMTLVTMGGSTLLIGLLPSYESIGIAAPLLLVLARMLQGFSIGGEYGGAILMTVEHAPPGRRGFFASVVGLGAPIGLALANGAFLLATLLPGETFMAWGWRLPFLVSVVLIVVGFVLRSRLDESPDFQRIRELGARESAPLSTVLRRYPVVTILAALSSIAAGVVVYLLTVTNLTYSVTEVGRTRTATLIVVVVTMLLSIPMSLAAGKAADRFGAPRTFVVGSIGMLVAVFPWVGLVSMPPLVSLFAGYLLLIIPYSVLQGVTGFFIAERFPVGIRYSGMSLAYTLGMLGGSAVAPIVSQLLITEYGTLVAVGVYVSAMCLLSATAAIVLLWLPKPIEETLPVDQAAPTEPSRGPVPRASG
ncbi:MULTISPECIES: MFS transporter [unclassified Pseudonocardia]|uniref:MFS transporter n=1 Tax=unclassified Pseudonocardia TaxID=2619320 RepID=UPI00143B9BED|nr:MULTISPECIES: MFS transporter [unclassified Pseudonocardia]